jgi:hypothetical protein
MNAKHKKKPRTKHRRAKANLQSALPIIVHRQVDAMNTKEQVNDKHQKKPETKHTKTKANL